MLPVSHSQALWSFTDSDPAALAGAFSIAFWCSEPEMLEFPFCVWLFSLLLYPYSALASTSDQPSRPGALAPDQPCSFWCLFPLLRLMVEAWIELAAFAGAFPSWLPSCTHPWPLSLPPYSPLSAPCFSPVLSLRPRNSGGPGSSALPHPFFCLGLLSIFLLSGFGVPYKGPWEMLGGILLAPRYYCWDGFLLQLKGVRGLGE